MSNALAAVRGELDLQRESFATVLADKSINFDREVGFAMQALQGNDYLFKVAQGNRPSLANAIVNVAAIGISLNPARKQAYLVPRDSKVCLDISYVGLLDLAIDSGSILWGQAEVVHEGDTFVLNGYDQPPTHQRNPFSKDRGPIIGAYVVVKTRDGDYLTTCMDSAEINAIRDRSEGYKAYDAKKIKSTPWADHYGEMAKKTVIKRAYKLWPKSERLAQAIQHLNTEGSEGIDSLSSTPRPADWIDVGPMIAEALATTTDDAALAYWRNNNGRLAKQKNDHQKLKDAVIAHRESLRAKAERNTIDVPMAEVQQPEGAPPAVDDEFVRAMDGAAA